VRETKLFLADFRNLLPSEVLYNLLADFSIIESNKLSSNAKHSSCYNNIKWLLGFIVYTGYMLCGYNETRVSHTEYIGTLLDLDLNCLKSFLDKLLVTLRDGIQASRARCHLRKKIKLRE
jgi:hypothetical protein